MLSLFEKSLMISFGRSLQSYLVKSKSSNVNLIAKLYFGITSIGGFSYGFLKEYNECPFPSEGRIKRGIERGAITAIVVSIIFPIKKISEIVR